PHTAFQQVSKKINARNVYRGRMYFCRRIQFHATQIEAGTSALDGKASPPWEVLQFLTLSFSAAGKLVLSETSTNGSGFLGSQVQWLPLGLCVVLTKCGLLSLIDHCQNSGDRFPNNIAEILVKKIRKQNICR